MKEPAKGSGKEEATDSTENAKSDTATEISEEKAGKGAAVTDTEPQSKRQKRDPKEE